MTDKQKRDLLLNVGDGEGSPLANDEAFVISFLFLHKTLHVLIYHLKSPT